MDVGLSGERRMGSSELLTVDQLASRLHIRRRTVQVWARQGRIPSLKLSPKVIRYDWEHVLKALYCQHESVQTNREVGAHGNASRSNGIRTAR
jgi:excisionase family DNA binding protein